MYVEHKSVKGARIGAAFIDYIFYSILNSIIVLVLMISTLTQFVYIQIIMNFLFAFIYFTLFPFLTKGSTIGKLLVKIKVVSFDYKKASFLKLLFRNVYLFNAFIIQSIGLLLSSQFSFTYSILFSFITFIINLVIFIMILATSDSRGLHDLIAGTIIVPRGFDLEKVNELNALERKAIMDWAEFEDESIGKLKQDQIVILEEKQDEIMILNDENRSE